jgi:hypothetical protein
VVEHILGHAMPRLVATYMPDAPLQAMREAVGKWSDEVERILETQPEEQGERVAPLQKRK